MVMVCINSLHQKSFSFLSIGWQRLCLPVEFVLGYDFVCLVHFCIISPAFLISLSSLSLYYSGIVYSQTSNFPFSLLWYQNFSLSGKKKKGSSVFMYHNNNCVPGAAISVLLMVYAGSYCDGQVLKEATRRRGFDNRKLAWKIESGLLYFLIFWW